MSIDVGYSYCTKLTQEEKIAIDKDVRLNCKKAKYWGFAPFWHFLLPRFPSPVEPMMRDPMIFTPMEIVRDIGEARDRLETAIADAKNQLEESCQEAVEESKEIAEAAVAGTQSEKNAYLSMNQRYLKAHKIA